MRPTVRRPRSTRAFLLTCLSISCTHIWGRRASMLITTWLSLASRVTFSLGLVLGRTLIRGLNERQGFLFLLRENPGFSLKPKSPVSSRLLRRDKYVFRLVVGVRLYHLFHFCFPKPAPVLVLIDFCFWPCPVPRLGGSASLWSIYFSLVFFSFCQLPSAVFFFFFFLY